jgi:hypothetical protein
MQTSRRPERTWSLVALALLVACERAPGQPAVVAPGASTLAPAAPALATATESPNLTACEVPKATATTTATSTIPARIFTDITPTMQGYAGAGARSSSLRRVHRMLDEAAAEATSVNPTRCSLGAKWQCLQADAVDRKKCVAWGTTPAVLCKGKVPDYGAPATYSAGLETSRLDEVLARKPAPGEVDPDHQRAPDWLDQAGLTVVVSSGFEPGPLASNSTSTDAACAAGPGPACISAALVERAREGYGVWIATLLLPFDGRYPADVPVDVRYLNDVKAHIGGLNMVATGQSTRYAGVAFKLGAQEPQRARGLNHSRFVYKGVRPLVFIALSRNHEAGRRFIKSLEAKLSGEPALRPGSMAFPDFFSSAELAPLGRTRYALGALELAPKGAGGQGDIDPAALAEFRFGNAGRSANGAWGEVNCGANGKGWVLARLNATPPALGHQAFATDELTMEGPTGIEPLPAQTSLARRNGGELLFRIFTSCAPLAERPSPWVIEYLLKVKTTVDQKALDAAWFSVNSAINVHEFPERVYGLREVAAAVVQQSVTHEGCLQRARLMVVRGK